MKLLRLVILFCGFLVAWQLIVLVTVVPAYILPGPLSVVTAIAGHWQSLLGHLLITCIEIAGGLVIGTLLGSCFALSMMLFPLVKRWMLPLLVMSQAIPVFALAPILVLWLGYGMASKIGMAVLIIFFPVASSFYYGMQRTDPKILELARVMDAGTSRKFIMLIIPSALPAFGSGLRVAAAVAPIGAVVGEWVGSSAGLGYYMLHANARMQIDMMFAALFFLVVASLSLYFLVDITLQKLIYWETPKE